MILFMEIIFLCFEKMSMILGEKTPNAKCKMTKTQKLKTLISLVPFVEN